MGAPSWCRFAWMGGNQEKLGNSVVGKMHWLQGSFPDVERAWGLFLPSAFHLALLSSTSHFGLASIYWSALSSEQTTISQLVPPPPTFPLE